ncbi:type IV secretory system conjugative DNA transfer family protein [Capnocytophaga canis]|uniref:hypothetical protein n=1 Tax=Capnocytophaga canis TaxID=1848903 RepID=UPI00385BB0FC
MFQGVLKNKLKEMKREYEKKSVIIPVEKKEKKVSISDTFRNIIPTKKGIYISNILRGVQITGVPGCGKTNIVKELVIQLISKGYSMYICDYTYPNLSLVAYNAFLKYQKNYEHKPQFCVINFEDITTTNSCNPIHSELLKNPFDAIQASKAFFEGLPFKKHFESKEIFKETLVLFLGACIWGLKLYKGGKNCSIAHLIELFSSQDKKSIFKFLSQFDDESISKFISHFEKLPSEINNLFESFILNFRKYISQLNLKNIYYIMNTEENTNLLQVNDPLNPKILCVGSNPLNSSLYAPFICLYNVQLMRQIQSANKNHTGIVFDDMSCSSFPPQTLEGFLVTSRGYRIAPILSYENLKKLAKNIGGETAYCNVINTILLNRFIGRDYKNNENLERGEFVGEIYNEGGEPIQFHEKINFDEERFAEYKKNAIPQFIEKKVIEEKATENFQRIKKEVLLMVKNNV